MRKNTFSVARRRWARVRKSCGNRSLADAHVNYIQIVSSSNVYLPRSACLNSSLPPFTFSFSFSLNLVSETALRTGRMLQNTFSTYKQPFNVLKKTNLSERKKNRAMDFKHRHYGARVRRVEEFCMFSTNCISAFTPVKGKSWVKRIKNSFSLGRRAHMQSRRDVNQQAKSLKA